MGCAGSLNLKPELSLTGCPAPGAPITLAITQGLPNSTALLVLGLGQSSLPLGAGCSLLASPLIGAPIVGLPLSTSGALFIPAAIPVGASGAAFTLQAFVVDAANPIGVSDTDGISVSIL